MILQHIVTFILQYRRKKVFYGWSAAEIKSSVQNAIDTDQIVVLSTDSNRILGVVIGKDRDNENKTITIENILFHPTLSRKEGKIALTKALNQFQKLYGEGWTFNYRRNKTPDRERVVGVEKLQSALA